MCYDRIIILTKTKWYYRNLEYIRIIIMNRVEDIILEFVEREYKLPDDADLNTYDLFANGYIDSMGLVQFVAILEDEFDIEFTADELLSEEFKTVKGIETIIMRKLESNR